MGLLFIYLFIYLSFTYFIYLFFFNFFIFLQEILKHGPGFLNKEIPGGIQMKRGGYQARLKKGTIFGNLTYL